VIIVLPIVLAIAGLVVSFACRTVIRRARACATSEHEPLRASLARCFLYYSVPFTVAVLALLALDVYVHRASGSLTYRELQALERRVDAVRGVTDRVVLPEREILLLVLALFAVNVFVYHRLRRTTRAVRLFSRVLRPYRNISTAVTVLLATFSAFTFLGTQLGAPRDRVELELASLRQGYAHLAARTQDVLRRQAPAVTVEDVIRRLPGGYVTALRGGSAGGSRMLDDENRRGAELRAYYAGQSPKYRVPDLLAETVIGRETSRQQQEDELRRGLSAGPRVRATSPGKGANDQAESPSAARAASSGPGESSSRSGKSSDPPPDTTRGMLAAAEKSLDAVEPPAAVTLLKDDRVEVKVQIGISIRESLAHVLAPLLQHVPLSEPLVGALNGLADESLDHAVRTKVPALVARIMKDPARAAQALAGAAHEVAREIPAGDPVRSRAVVAQVLAQKVRELDALAAARPHLDAAINKALIARLSSGSQEQAEAVAGALRDRAHLINQQQVARLMKIMRRGTRRWVSDPYRPWADAHCTCRAHRSVRAYAAEALLGMDAQLVSDELRAEAMGVQVAGLSYTKVSAPGWVCSVDGDSSARTLCSY